MYSVLQELNGVELHVVPAFKDRGPPGFRRGGRGGPRGGGRGRGGPPSRGGGYR